MRNKTHFILLLLIAALFVVPATFAQDDEPIELTIAGVSGDELVWINDYVAPTFQERMAEQGINVEINAPEFAGTGEDLRQQYALDLGVGEGADLLAFDGFWLPEFVEGELLQPLTEVVGEEALEWEGWEVIPEGLQGILGFEGNIYGIARGTDGRVLWYRTDLFEQAGLPTDWQPNSWQEILDAADTITTELENVTALQLDAGTSMGEATTMQGYLMSLLGAGHHIYDFEDEQWIVSSPAILDTLELYETIYIQTEYGNSRWQLVENGRDLSMEAFANGEVAMLVEGDWFWRSPMNPNVGNYGIENREEVVNFALMPAQNPGEGFQGQDFVTVSGGTGFVLNPNTENADLAWELLTFMFSTEALEELQALQPRIRARTDVPVTGDAIMSRIASEALPYTTVRPQLPEYNQVSFEAQLMTERVVSGEMTPMEAMEAYAEAVTEIVGEENVKSIPLE